MRRACKEAYRWRRAAARVNTLKHTLSSLSRSVQYFIDVASKDGVKKKAAKARQEEPSSSGKVRVVSHLEIVVDM